MAMGRYKSVLEMQVQGDKLAERQTASNRPSL